MERMITRTIQKKMYTCIVFKCNTNEVIESDFIITEKITDNDAALKILRKRYEGDTLKIAAIKSTHIEEKLYAMSEVDFLKYAHIVEKEDKEKTEE